MHVSYRFRPQRYERITLMTSPLRKKHQITAQMSRAQEITRTWAGQWTNRAKQSLAAAIAFGLSFTATTHGQQTPTWSPQPFSKPNAAQSAPSHAAVNSIPHNSLRSGTTEPATTLRWSKVEGSSATQPSSYSQAMKSEPSNSPSATNGNEELPRVSRSKVVKHNQLANRVDSSASPATGWNSSTTPVVTASAQQPVQNSRPKDLVDLASHESMAQAPARMKSWLVNNLMIKR